MKQPVDPAALEVKQERNKYVLYTASSLTGLVIVITAFTLCMWLARGDAETMAIVGIAGGALGLALSGPCGIGLVNNGRHAIEFHNSYRWALNKRAWDAQQEELKRLRTIMKEENL